MKIQFNRLLVSIIGIILILGAAYAVWHWIITPAQDILKEKRATFDGIKEYDDAKLASTRTFKEKEFAKLAQDESQYNEYMSRFMPMLDFSRRDVGMISYWHEATGVGSKIVTNFAVKDPIVNVMTASLSVPPPPTNPNDSLFDQKLITYTGSVSVRGDFRSILNNITRWSNAPRLVLVSPSISMTMSGYNPNNISATYSITCFVFPRNTGGDTISMASASSGSGMGRTGSMPGMGGSMMMGAPTMPSSSGMQSAPGMTGVPSAPTSPSTPSAR